MADSYDAVKARQISQSFNGATGAQGIANAASNATNSPSAIDRRLMKAAKPE